jgi:hypothetical protein
MLTFRTQAHLSKAVLARLGPHQFSLTQLISLDF